MPFTITPEKAKLRAQFELDVAAEIGRVGPAGFQRHLMVARWAHAGAGRSTIWRWLKETVDDPAGVGRHFTQGQVSPKNADGSANVEASTAGPERVNSAANPPITKASVTHSNNAPAAPPQTASASTGHGSFAIMDNLQRCITAANRVMANAQRAPNDARSARLVIQASEHLRRCMETAIRLHDELWNVARVEEFHSAIIAEVATNDAPTAERIMLRLEEIAHRWGTLELGNAAAR